MVKFDNLETTLAYKWFINVIDEVLEENKGKNMVELQCILSEAIGEKINEDLSNLTEGFVSEIIQHHYESIDYLAMIEHYLKYN